MRIGYARVSMQDQNLLLQTDALEKANCDRIFDDKISGSKRSRSGLDECMQSLKPGDTLIVWKLDRLGRSLLHLVEMMNQFKESGVAFISLTESIDTSTPGGKLIFHIFAAMAEFVRDTIRERTMAGLEAARARGRFGGRPAKLEGKTLDMFTSLANDPKNTKEDICRMVKISLPTFYRYKKLIEQP